MRILDSCAIYKFQTLNPGCPPSQPHTFWLTAIRRHIRAALCFCSCELRWRTTECVLLPCFNALPDIFAVMNWGPFYEVKQRSASFLRGFSGMLPRFSANQNVWGCACTPKSNTTAVHNSIIGNFVVYQDRLESHGHCSFSSTQKIHRIIFYNFCYCFWGQHCLNRNKHNR